VAHGRANARRRGRVGGHRASAAPPRCAGSRSTLVPDARCVRACVARRDRPAPCDALRPRLYPHSHPPPRAPTTQPFSKPDGGATPAPASSGRAEAWRNEAGGAAAQPKAAGDGGRADGAAAVAAADSKGQGNGAKHRSGGIDPKDAVQLGIDGLPLQHTGSGDGAVPVKLRNARILKKSAL
jgi:hypothetical protein